MNEDLHVDDEPVRLVPPALAGVDDTVARMAASHARFEAEGDPRAEFLAVYHHTTCQVRRNLHEGRFLDADWVATLTARFADLYFVAEDAWDRGDACPAAWDMAFRLGESGAPPLERVMLGMNAHITYDLPFAVADLLRARDLAHAPADATLARRRFDHETVNSVLAETIPGALGLLGDRIPAAWRLVHRLVGDVEEIFIDLGLRNLRGRVWNHALAVAFAPDAATRERARRQIERDTLSNAARLDRLRRIRLVPARPHPQPEEESMKTKSRVRAGGSSWF